MHPSLTKYFVKGLGIGLLALACLAGAVFALAAWLEFSQSAGTFTVQREAERACLKKLSRELRRSSAKQEHRVYFKLSTRGAGKLAVLYVPSYQLIGLEGDPGSGFTARWTNVNNNLVHAVAETNGSLKDFGEVAWGEP